MKIKEFSKKVGISAYTLRYYEKEHLIFVNRDSNGIRNYSKQDVVWLTFLIRLKDTGMSIKEMRQYAHLRNLGDTTLQLRLEMLEKHRIAVKKELEKWEDNLVNLEQKIIIYSSMIEKKH